MNSEVLMGTIFLIFLFAYLAGSINFAIIFFKITDKGDPRLSYSGNAGTTNVYRQAGRGWATIIFMLDIGRALLVAAAAMYYVTPAWLPWAGFFLVLGNSYPCFHGFHGGKGVANYLGFTLLAAPWAALAAAIVWLIIYGIIKVPFIASFVMVFTLACGQAFNIHGQPVAVAGAIATFLLIVFNHRKNIVNYRRPAEPHVPGQ